MPVKIVGDFPDFKAAAAAVDPLTRAVVVKSAAMIESLAKQAAPVRTGNLRNSISFDVSADGLTAEIGPTASYAPFLEYGTSRMAPRPFLMPAAEAVQPQFEAALEQVAEKALEA